MIDVLIWAVVAVAAAYVLRHLVVRLQLSRAKHPSLRGHAKMARRVARLVPFYEYGDDEFFSCDRAPADVVERRRAAFERIGEQLRTSAPKTLRSSEELEKWLDNVGGRDD